MFNCTYDLKLLYKEVPEVGSCAPKHVAVCDMTLLKCLCFRLAMIQRKTRRDASE